MTPILALTDITHQFPHNPTRAVDEVNLSLNQGEILGLLGPSGCGKTTLLRLIGGFETPQSGKIELAGQMVADRHRYIPPERRDVGMVFQDYALFPHLTVAENIGFGLKAAQGANRKTVSAAVDEAIALVGLQGMESRYPHELSGGQQQRVALARALAPRPAVVLLDEPLSNLDVRVRLYLRQEVRDILKATGATAIFVTHDQEEAMAIADRVGVMRQGRLEQLDTPEAIYNDPASQFVAEFVTQANFLPAQRQGNFWTTELGQFPIDRIHCTCDAAWEICQTEPSIGDLMIRQEAIALTPDAEGRLVVRGRQFLGREYCYRLQTPGGQTLQARTPQTIRLEVGDRVNLTVPNQTLRFFPHLEKGQISPATLELQIN